MKKLFSDFTFSWALGLFGTAVGAGVLFLPINAGMSGFWPLIIMTLIVGPMTYYAHRGLARFVLSSTNPGQDITYVVQEHFGVTGGRLITLLYFLAIYPILLIYGVGITNTVISFIENQLHMTAPSRAVVSFVLLAVMIGIMLLNERIILAVTNWLVYPLIAIIFGLSLYLIPQWNGAALHQVPTVGGFLKTLADHPGVGLRLQPFARDFFLRRFARAPLPGQRHLRPRNQPHPAPDRHHAGRLRHALRL